jgi:cation diffusion facilitator family transporter
MDDHVHAQHESAHADSAFAMRLSLIFGVLMLAGKGGAWWITGSAAILSDALESVVHIVAVAFAAFALSLSRRPADSRFHYGYERISFFSAGFEGAMIVLAAFSIIWVAVYKWLAGIPLENLSAGIWLTFAASAVNLALGLYLLAVGKRNRSIILEANGKHVLTDCWTSFGVVAGLLLVQFTGWKHFDPLCAIGVAINILWSGGNLMWRSAQGLLDYADPDAGRKLRAALDRACAELRIDYHGVRFRGTGNRVIVEVHLLFPYDLPLGQAHTAATRVEEVLESVLDIPVEVITHLEAREDHGETHTRAHYTGRP